MMFPNTNKGVIKKMIRRSLKANRSRNRYVILAIVMTTWLITSVFSIGLSYIKSFEMEQQKMMGTKADAALTNPTDEQLAQLKQLPYVKEIGLNTKAAEIVSPNGDELKANMHLYDAVEWEIMKSPLMGNKINLYPQQRNEIIVPTWILEQMGIEEPEVGMPLNLTYRTADSETAEERTEPFILSGWYTDYTQLRLGEPGVILVSAAFVEQLSDSGAERMASIAFDNGSRTMSNIEQLERELKLGQGQHVISYSQGSDNSSKASTYAGIALISAFIMFSGYLLIYNVLYISVSNETKFYGLLKTIGMTRRQVKRMVNGQAIRLSCIGIPIGLAAGAITSLVAVPLAIGVFALETDVEISFHPVIFAGSALFSWITVMAGYRKPARIAAKISPVEASKYVRASGKKSRGGSKLYRMAIRNIFRDKKRALTVFLSLFLGLTTFLTINTLILSMDTKNFVASYVEDDFSIVNKTAELGFQGEKKQKLTDELVHTIERMKGVTSVRSTYIESIQIDYSAEVFGKYVDDFVNKYNADRPSDEDLLRQEMFWSLIIGLDSRYIEELNKTLETPIDIEKFENGEIALLGDSSGALTIGDSFRVSVPNSASQSFYIGGTVSPQFMAPYGGMAPNVYVSQNVMKQLISDPIIYKMSVMAERNQWSAIQDKLEALTAADQGLTVSSKQQWMDMLDSAKTIFYILGGAITLILALIGILNFVSTMFTSVLVRKHELAIMESIGMTKKQLRKMLMLEGAGYAVISLSLIATFGTLMSYGAYYLFSQEADYAIYTYPTIPLLIAFALVAGACLAVPLIAFSQSKKLTVVERLREV